MKTARPFLVKFLLVTLAAPASARVRRSSSSGSSSGSSGSIDSDDHPSGPAYEVWASDQSNSVTGAAGAGTEGSYLWIWDADSIASQLAGDGDAVPLPCAPGASEGPCDLFDVFPTSLVQRDPDGTVLGTLDDLPSFGRLHGMIKDPSNRYVTANIFAPGGGYVGIIDTQTKGAVGLFRVARTTGSGAETSVHMSIWTADGSAIIVANLHGKMIERINVVRDGEGTITYLELDQSAAVYLGKGFSLLEGASYFTGPNAFGDQLIGQVAGSYDDADTGDLTPAGVCKEASCGGTDNQGGLRTNNVPICPIVSQNDNGYITMGSGGLFVLKLDQTPMKIIAEYGNAIVNGAGCGGIEGGDLMFLNGGVSASGAGATQSTFTVYGFRDDEYAESMFSAPVENLPSPIQVFKDPTNTNTIGNVDGTAAPNGSGQLPSLATRRDSHGAQVTADGRYLHVADRIGNVIEVFDTATLARVNAYDLVSTDGKSGRAGPAAACLAASVLDDALLPRNDPAPDLFDITPDGRYLMFALRGPKPVSAGHAAQGSCPGAGIVELTEGGKAGRLVGVLRSTNVVDDVAVGTIAGGRDYTGVERSDIHGVEVIAK